MNQIQDNNKFELLPCYKKYTLDQDKAENPILTYNNTLNKLINAYPYKNFILRHTQNNNFFNVYDFGDGFLTSHGKGITKHQAKASAIMEYTERRSWLDFNYLNASGYCYASFEELKQKHNLHEIESIFNLPRKNINQELTSDLKKIKHDWVSAYNLTTSQPTMYPISFNNIYQTSNGLASGNTKEEAILQGLCEVIERHNLSCFLQNYQKQKLKIIDISSLKNQNLKNLLEYSNQQNIKITFIDISDEIPVCTILARGEDHLTNNKIASNLYGFGTSPDPEKAMLRAITEYFQGKQKILNNKNIDDLEQLNKKGNWQLKLNIDIDNPLIKKTIIKASELKSYTHNNITIELTKIIKTLKKINFSVIICNKTHPKLKIPVFRIIIPGLIGLEEFQSMTPSGFLILINCLAINTPQKDYKIYLEKYQPEILASLIEQSSYLFPNKNDFESITKYINMYPQKILEDIIIFFKGQNYLHHINSYLAKLNNLNSKNNLFLNDEHLGLRWF